MSRRFPLLRVPRTVAVALAATAAVARADPAPLTVAVTPSWTSEYLFRGQRYSGASFQPGVDLASGWFDSGIWSSFPLGEVDLYASGTFAIASQQSVQPGFTLYTFAHPGSAPARGHAAAFEPSLAWNATIGGVRLTPKGYVDVDRRVTTGELDAAAAVPLRTLGTELDFGASIGAYRGYTSGPRYEGGYWLAQASVPYQLPHHLRFTATAGYSAGFATTRAVALRAGRVFVSLALSGIFP